MNILFADQFSEPGGAQLCLMDLLPEIVRRGWFAHVAAPGDGTLISQVRGLNLPVYNLPLSPYSNGRKGLADVANFAVEAPEIARMLGRVIGEQRIDLVYVNGPRVMPATTSLEVPVIFHAHSVVSGNSARLLKWSLKKTKATLIAASAYVARGLPQSEVIYNGVPDYAGERGNSESPRVGILGRIAPEKGHLDFMHAAAAVSGATFHVFGESLFSDPSYATLVRAAAPPNRTVFEGWTSDPGATLRDLDILAVPSGPAEAATRVIMEAFSAGTPVIAYRSGGIPELIDHERTGLLIDPHPTALAEGIQRLISDSEMCHRLALNGREEWRARFTQSAFREAVCRVISRVNDDSPATR